jgi:hypothetical protein
LAQDAHQRGVAILEGLPGLEGGNNLFWNDRIVAEMARREAESLLGDK